MSSPRPGASDNDETLSTPTSKPYLHPISISSEENFIHHVSTASASEALLDDGFRQPIYPRRPIWKRLLSSITPRRRKRRSKENGDGSCLDCEKSVCLPRRWKGWRTCMIVGFGILIMLYGVPGSSPSMWMILINRIVGLYRFSVY